MRFWLTSVLVAIICLGCTGEMLSNCRPAAEGQRAITRVHKYSGDEWLANLYTRQQDQAALEFGERGAFVPNSLQAYQEAHGLPYTAAVAPSDFNAWAAKQYLSRQGGLDKSGFFARNHYDYDTATDTVTVPQTSYDADAACGQPAMPKRR